MIPTSGQNMSQVQPAFLCRGKARTTRTARAVLRTYFGPMFHSVVAAWSSPLGIYAGFDPGSSSAAPRCKIRCMSQTWHTARISMVSVGLKQLWGVRGGRDCLVTVFHSPIVSGSQKLVFSLWHVVFIVPAPFIVDVKPPEPDHSNLSGSKLSARTDSWKCNLAAPILKPELDSDWN